MDKQNTSIADHLVELARVMAKVRFAPEPYDDVKPRDWVSDRKNLQRAHQEIKEMLAELTTRIEGEL